MNEYSYSNERQALTVTQLNTLVHDVIESNDIFSYLTVRGEISNFVHHRSGHLYFSLKDEGSLVRAVMFRSAASRLNFTPENGMKVIVYASLTTYLRDGQYQLTVTAMEPDGIGALYLAFEKRKRRLAAEGLFDQARKRPLPLIPTHVGVITSPTGAAVRDIIRILGRRFPCAKVTLFPAQVQGEGAARSMIRGLSLLNEETSVDVIILGRGGGSAEDLWEFNDEALARAVFASRVPVISAVGHESDFTICDFVADVRAATPSAAAEIAVPELGELKRRLLGTVDRLSLLCERRMKTDRKRLEMLSQRRIFTDPEGLYRQSRMRLDAAYASMQYAIERRRQAAHATLEEVSAKLHALSPLAVLSRGYALAQTEGGVVRKTEDLPVGTRFCLRLSDGEIAAERISEKKEKEL